MELRRKMYDQLVDWKHRAKGTSALLIEGPRRVGKSFIAKKFAENEYKSHIIIDFSMVSDDFLEEFSGGFGNLDRLFSFLKVFYQVPLYERESLIVFDEVQLYPKARQMIKQLVSDGRYDYLETGSLLSMKTNVQNILIPSEEESVSMYPLDFEEFLWAMNDEQTIPYLKECFEARRKVGTAVHRKVMRTFRTYCLVGGMPQAVRAFLETNDFQQADNVKRLILSLYKKDMIKFAQGYEYKVISIFEAIPAQLSRHDKKFKVGSVSRNARFRTYEESFIWLQEAMITNPCFNTTDPNVGLGLTRRESSLKNYMMDTGLLVTHAFSDSMETDHNVYRAVLLDKLEINEGMLMENAVAQILRTNGHALYFYSVSDREKKENRMEIDFLIAEKTPTKSKLSVIEVKSGKRYTYTSLNKFKKKYSSRVNNLYILHTGDVEHKEDVLCLPVYMAVFL